MEKPGYAPNYLANHRRSLEGEMDSDQVTATSKQLLAECQRLRDEINRLRQILIEHGIKPDPVLPKGEAPSPSGDT